MLRALSSAVVDVLLDGTVWFDLALLVLLLNVGVLAHILLKHDKSNGESPTTLFFFSSPGCG